MKQILITALTLLTLQLHAADYYWTGGSGSWSQLSHWHLGSSAGPTPSIVPSSTDNVFFDANSGFTAVSQTVTLDANGFCNNMTWTNVPGSPLFVTANSAFTVQVNGNASLSPTTTYKVLFAFKGATAASLTTNGTVLGEFGIEIDKPGSSLTVTDSLIVPATTNVYGTNVVAFTSGTFDITGKKVKVYSFYSDNSNVRTLEMVNTNFTASGGYRFYGLNKTINATGSTLYTGYFVNDGGTYNKATVTNASGPNTIIIDNSTFSSLTFSPVSGGYSDIGSNNIVDTLIFTGQGAIGNNNTVGSIRFGMLGSLAGTGNVIGKLLALNDFQVAGNFTNTVDSLILAANHTTTFKGTFNINDYLYLAGAPCAAFTEIYGDTTTGTVNFAAGAVADINNVILTGVHATGPITPIAVNGVDGGGNLGFTITEPAGTGTTFYWVGGAGDWNNINHWSTTSGGTGGACVPFMNDNVVFDANSGLAGGTVTTSSATFCKDMTWVAGVGTVSFNSVVTFRIYGSVVLQSTVSMNAFVDLRGDDSTSITMNGSSTSTGVLWNITKTGNAAVTLMDNWTAPLGTFQLNQGGFSMAGRTVSMYRFVSRNNLVRNLDITNATITVSNQWQYYGSGRTLAATGSHITSQVYFVSNAPATNYPWVDLNYAGTDASVFDITSTTFGQLTFNFTSATSVARISGSNTIRRLEFKGAGALIGGSNNIDSLILAGSRNYYFTGTNTISKYLKAQATTCSGLTEMRGNPTGTLAFGATAIVDIANVYMQNLTATGTITPIAFNGANAGGNTGWTINSPAGSPRYWIGSSGDWNDPNHWSTTSGGIGGACVPTVYDNVYFDGNSGFTAVSKTVTINAGNAYCQNMDWTGAPNSPLFNKSASFTLEIWGDLVMNPTVAMNAAVTFTGPGNKSVTSNGATLGNFDIYSYKPAGSALIFQDNYSNSQTRINLGSGTLNLSGRTISCEAISDNLTTTPTVLNITGATIMGAWSYLGTSKSLQAANSKLTVIYFEANGGTYNMVDVTATGSASISISSTTFDSLVFSNSTVVSGAWIGAGNTINYLEFKDKGSISGNGNTINTLVFFPGKIYTFTAGTTTNITGDWFASGTPCNLTEIVSSSTTASATINKTGGAPEFDYVRVRRINATGSTPFVGFNHTIDLGNNTNWSISPYNGAAPILGLGADTAIYATDFPYVLNTEGFFGSPSSQYTWNNGSTADTLIAADTGTYGVTVTFPDGCTISDSIHLTFAVPLPVTLTAFTADVQQCQPRLSWTITDAVNFSHFIIERSMDGRNFISIGTTLYAKDAYNYTYNDKTSDRGTIFYRLKLVDVDGKDQYSNVVSVQSNCDEQTVKVYPTISNGTVYVSLPEGYEKATLSVFNILSQQLSLSPDDKGRSLRSIKLNGQSAGTYFIRITNGNHVESHKIIYKP